MGRQLDYLVEIKGNEALLERFIAAINNDICKTDKDYPYPYLLSSGEKFLNSKVIEYFFQTRPCSKELYIDFFEKLRKLEPDGFKAYSYHLGKWITERWKSIGKLQPGSQLSDEEKGILGFICYVAVCHIKYGASFERVTANKYFNMVATVDAGGVAGLKENGTGSLPKNITEYRDDNLFCKANDVLGTIKLEIVHETEEAYSKALTFICNLLKTDFPKSFSIEFSAPSQSVLPIKGLPECGQHHLFANAVKYPALHPQIVAYINLAKGKWEWYNNLEEEHCAMPSTFAVFALGLDNEKYFDVVIDYMRTVDDEHQSIQGEFVPVFVEKYGINSESVKVYINCIMSMQELPHNKVFLHQFTDEAGLNLLLDSKTNFVEYYFTEEDMEEMEDSGNDTDEIAGYIWERILYTTFGEKKNYEGILKQYPDKLKALFDKI